MAPTGDQVALALGRLRWVVHAARVVAAARRFRALAEKANFNPDQPRVPRGHGRESGRWTYVEGWARDESELPVILASDSSPNPVQPPKIPRIRPPSGRARNLITKEIARWLWRGARLGLRVSPYGRFIDAFEVGLWVYEQWPYVEAYLDEPKTLEELKRAVATPRKGTDVHHIVERTRALRDGIDPAWVDGPENLVRIPTLKHWELNRWYESENKRFGGLVPRAYLQGKSEKERYNVGLEGLEAVKVLKR